METISLTRIFLVFALGMVAAFLFWRYVWFFRNPDRTVAQGENIVSPADGTVVYVKRVQANEEVIVIKRGVAARIKDIVRQDMDAPKLVIGIFMSPLMFTITALP